MVSAAIIATLRFVRDSYSGKFARLSNADGHEMAGFRIYQNFDVLKGDRIAGHPVDRSNPV
jgi:hypothetical protein